MKNQIRKQVAAILLFGLSICFFVPETSKMVYARNHNTIVLTNPYTNPGQDSINVGLEGEFVAGQQAALNRINEIRLEACKKGYKDPRDTSRCLTEADYVPIKWSADLENYARIRAAEAAVLTSHGRPGTNAEREGVEQPITGSSEVLAWGTSSLVGGVNLWYSEKETWVQGGSGVTGHYTSMINPNNTYVGIGGFSCANGLGSSWGGSICGRFYRNRNYVQSNSVTMNETMAPARKNVIQVISVNKKYLSGPELISNNKNAEYQLGDKDSFFLGYHVKFTGTDDDGIAVVLDLQECTFRASNNSILKSDSYGNICALREGSAVLTATTKAGSTYTKKVKVKTNMKKPKILKLKGSKKALTVNLSIPKSGVYECNGVEIQIATNKAFTQNVKKAKVKIKYKYWNVITRYRKTFNKLKAHKKYYVRARCYVKRDKKVYNTKWCKTGIVRVK